MSPVWMKRSSNSNFKGMWPKTTEYSSQPNSFLQWPALGLGTLRTNFIFWHALQLFFDDLDLDGQTWTWILRTSLQLCHMQTGGANIWSYKPSMSGSFNVSLWIHSATAGWHPLFIDCLWEYRTLHYTVGSDGLEIGRVLTAARLG